MSEEERPERICIHMLCEPAAGFSDHWPYRRSYAMIISGKAAVLEPRI